MSLAAPSLISRSLSARSETRPLSAARSVSQTVSRSVEHIFPAEGASWRRLRDLILPVLQLRVLRAVRRGDPVMLGTRRHPFEAVTDRHGLLDLLPDDRSLVVRLCCRSREVLDDLPRLVRLDRRHDLSVDWWLDRPRRLAWTRSSLEAAGRLAAEGIRVRLVWRADQQWEADDLESWAAAARRLRIWDLRCETDSPELLKQVEIVRMEYGFPTSFSGRG